MSQLVRFEADEDGVATITLDRPGRLNAINMAMRDLLWDYIGACRQFPGLRALVFRGAGPAFSAGADISEFGTAPSVLDARRARHDRDIWAALLDLPLPTIAVMHGFCYGAGLELPLCCDYRLAAAGTRLGLPEVRLGYMPSACATQTLPRRAPPAVAAAMILTGDPIEARDALEWGVIDQLEAPGALDAALARVVASLAAAEAPAAFMARRLALRVPRVAAPA
jgi:enoyl-CoA hydratase/carnithine racemase